jgi:hypothetical protein
MIQKHDSAAVHHDLDVREEFMCIGLKQEGRKLISPGIHHFIEKIANGASRRKRNLDLSLSYDFLNIQNGMDCYANQ